MSRGARFKRGELSEICARFTKTDAPPAETKADVALEKDLQRLVENDLRTHGVTFHHDRVSKGNVKGWPDVTFCVMGWPTVVELKTPTGRVSDEQARVMDGLKRDGWRVYVVRSWAEWREVMAALTGGRWARGEDWRKEQ